MKEIILQETIAQQALRLLSDVPKNRFIKNSFTDGKYRCCSLGHWFRLRSNDPNDYSSWNCSVLGGELAFISNKFLLERFNLNRTISSVNDGLVAHYQEKAIKDRVIHLLKDMIEAGY